MNPQAQAWQPAKGVQDPKSNVDLFCERKAQVATGVRVLQLHQLLIEGGKHHNVQNFDADVDRLSATLLDAMRSLTFFLQEAIQLDTFERNSSWALEMMVDLRLDCYRYCLAVSQIAQIKQDRSCGEKQKRQALKHSVPSQSDEDSHSDQTTDSLEDCFLKHSSQKGGSSSKGPKLVSRSGILAGAPETIRC